MHEEGMMKLERKLFAMRLIGTIIVIFFGGIYVFNPSYLLLIGILIGGSITFIGGSKWMLKRIK